MPKINKEIKQNSIQLHVLPLIFYCVIKIIIFSIKPFFPYKISTKKPPHLIPRLSTIILTPLLTM